MFFDQKSRQQNRPKNLFRPPLFDNIRKPAASKSLDAPILEIDEDKDEENSLTEEETPNIEEESSEPNPAHTGNKYLRCTDSEIYNDWRENYRLIRIQLASNRKATVDIAKDIDPTPSLIKLLKGQRRRSTIAGSSRRTSLVQKPVPSAMKISIVQVRKVQRTYGANRNSIAKAKKSVKESKKTDESWEKRKEEALKVVSEVRTRYDKQEKELRDAKKSIWG